eukprot:9391038-Alexandrium_andersonii.AAC.1
MGFRYYSDDLIWSQRDPGGPYIPMDRAEWDVAHPELAALMAPVPVEPWAHPHYAPFVPSRVGAHTRRTETQGAADW